MAGNRPRHIPSQTPDRLPARDQGSKGASGPGSAMLDLQRSAGNRATASFVTQAPESALQLSAVEGGGETMVQRSIGSWFKKKFGKKENGNGNGISSPTGGHAMTEEEQGGVPSMKQLIEQHEKSQNGSVNTPPP